MIDLGPAATRVAALLARVDDRDLPRSTPCPDSTVGDLIDHVGSLTLAFTASADKRREGQTGSPPRPSAGNLEPGWRDRARSSVAAGYGVKMLSCGRAGGEAKNGRT